MVNQLKRLPLTSDIVFKRVFSKEGNEDVLKALLEAILEISIQNVVIKNPELPRNLYDSKAGVLDVKVEIDTHTLCDIEMHYIELPKFIKKNSNADTAIEQWLWLFADRRDKLEMAKNVKKEIKKAMEIIDQMSMDEKEWELYRSREMAIMDYEANMHKSKEEIENLQNK